MRRTLGTIGHLAGGVAVGLLVAGAPARAADQSGEIKELKAEIELLKAKVEQLEQRQAAQPAAAPPGATAAAPAPAAAAPAPAGAAAPPATALAKLPEVSIKNRGLQIGPVNIRPGGFIEAAGIYRTKNQVADVGSDFNQGIPFRSSPLAHQRETRFSARQSRLSLLVQGDVSPATHLTAYVESDFLGAGSSSNSRESNSYTPRLRVGYATLDKDDWGLHVLGGQQWSLLTTNKVGIVPRTEQIPLTIDAQYVVGFNWLRVPQFRLTQDFGSGIWAGMSVESPQMVTSPITAPTPGCTAASGPRPCVNYTNPGNPGGLLNPSTSYSTDDVPDVIAKVAFDPGWGHYEVKSLLRTFTLRAAGSTHHTVAASGGGAAIVPVVPKYLDAQASGMFGSGLGRYGSGQLPDAAFGTDLTSLDAVKEWQVLAGLVAHPWWGNDLYVYGGWEHADRTGATGVFLDKSGKFAGAPGYGSPFLDVSGCTIPGSGACQAQTRQLRQITAGFWQDVYNGDYGRFTFGLEGGEIWRDAFSGVGGSPSTNIAIFMSSLRYYPNQ